MERIHRERAVTNGRTWARFLASRSGQLLAEVKGYEPVPPDITLEPSVFTAACVELCRELVVRVRG